MDDLSINTPVTHERTKAHEGNPRRYSTGKIFSLDGGEKVPNYLRASTGSCHDFCKFGRKDELEVKARCPVKSVPRKLPTKSPNSQSSVESVVFPEKKNVSVIKLKHSPVPKSLLLDTFNITKQQLSKKSIDSQSSVGSELLAARKKTSMAKLKSSSSSKSHVYVAPKTMEQEVSLSPDKLEVSSKKVATKLKEKNLSAKHVTSSKPKSLVVKELSSLDTSGGSGALLNSDLKIGRKTGTSLKPKSLVVKEFSSADTSGGSRALQNSDLKIGRRTGVSLKPKSLVVKEFSSPDTSGGSRALQNRDLKIGRRTGVSLKPKSLSSKQISSPESSGGLKGQRNSDVKIGKRAGASIVALKKVSVPPIAPISPRPVLRRVASLKKAQKNRTVQDVSPLKNQNKIRKAKPEQLKNDDVQEKTLYVIKVETENKPSESDQKKNCEVEPSPPSSPKSLCLTNSVSFPSHEGEDQESEYTTSGTEDDYFSEDNEVDYIENADTLVEDGKRKPRKSGMVCSEDKDGKPLKFRRGTVVDMQFENDSPRRLKFRRGRVLGENQNFKAVAHRRSYKKRGVDGDKIGTESGAEKVVLRHQDVQGKKDDKGLFNNVIEETASKLVETRKSKVKALVGAFETVISLQERKPSANTVA